MFSKIFNNFGSHDKEWNTILDQRLGFPQLHHSAMESKDSFQTLKITETSHYYRNILTKNNNDSKFE